MTPKEAFDYALEHGASDETREIVCQDPKWALEYAYHVDKGPRDDTREAVCKDPWSAYQYAYLVDGGPRDDTREAVSKDLEVVNWYIEDLDGGKIHPIFTKALRPSVLAGDEWALKIFKEFVEMTNANDT